MAYTINYDQVSSLVQDFYVPRIKDNFFLSNAFFYRQRKTFETYSGGRSIVVPLSYTAEGGGGVWWSGTDRMDTRVRNPIQSAQYFGKNAAVPLSIDQDEEDAVGGDTAVVSLVNAKMKIANRTADDLVGGATGLFNDGSNPKALSGLQFDLPANIATVQQTFGGIARGGAASTNAWWMHQSDVGPYATGSTYIDSSAINMAPWDKMWAQIGLASGKKPTMVLCNWGVYTAFHQWLQFRTSYFRPQQDTELAKAGYDNVIYKNAIVVVDEKVPRTAAKVETAYFLNEGSMFLKMHAKRQFTWSGWKEAYDQFARVGYIQFRGELCFDEMRCNGVQSAITTSTLS